MKPLLLISRAFINLVICTKTYLLNSFFISPLHYISYVNTFAILLMYLSKYLLHFKVFVEIFHLRILLMLYEWMLSFKVLNCESDEQPKHHRNWYGNENRETMTKRVKISEILAGYISHCLLMIITILNDPCGWWRQRPRETEFCLYKSCTDSAS